MTKKAELSFQIADVLIKTLRREFDRRQGKMHRNDVINALAHTLVIMVSDAEPSQVAAVVTKFTDTLMDGLVETLGVDLEELMTAPAETEPPRINGHTVH